MRLYVSLLTLASARAFSNVHPLRTHPLTLHTSRVYSSSSSETPSSPPTPTTTSEEKRPGHDVRSSVSAHGFEIDEEELQIQQRYAKHQQEAPRLGFAADIRSLVQYNHGWAVLSTNSKSKPGYPGGSVVGFAPDADGQPIFIFSGMSGHTQDILVDPRCSITIASKEFKGAADGRVSMMGTCTLVPPAERDAAKAVYLAKHPDAFWVDFGDFNWFRMKIEDIRFVGGFARAGAITAEQYHEAKPDPIAAFGMHIAKHMNEDHMENTIAMIAQQIPGLDVTEAIITSVDSLGMYVKVSRTPRATNQPQQFKLRLPFLRQAKDRKDVKDLIVEMTRGSSS